MPARIIFLSTLQHQPPFKEGDHFTLNGPIPEALFDVTEPAQGGNEFVVIERPNIRFPYLPELA